MLARAEPGLSSYFERFTAKVAEDKATREAMSTQSVADWLRYVCSYHQCQRYSFCKAVHGATSSAIV
jgi:hypothetical protein